MFAQRPVAAPDAPPRLILHDDLCREVFDSRQFGERVRMVTRYAPVAVEPLAWEYRPGWPPLSFAPTVRMLFTSQPPMPHARMIVSGTVNRIDPDDRPRKSRHLGVLVLTDCEAQSPVSP